MKILKLTKDCQIDLDDLTAKITTNSHGIPTYDPRVSLINGSFYLDMYLATAGGSWELFLPDNDGDSLDKPQPMLKIGVAMVPMMATENEAKAAALEMIEGLRW